MCLKLFIINFKLCSHLLLYSNFISDLFLVISGWRLVKWSSFWSQNFNSVETSQSYLVYHSSCFEARFSVSTKEFLWDSSFKSNLNFFRGSGPYNLMKISRIRCAEGVMGFKIDRNRSTLPSFPFLVMEGLVIVVVFWIPRRCMEMKHLRVKVVNQTSDRLFSYLI